MRRSVRAKHVTHVSLKRSGTKSLPLWCRPHSPVFGGDGDREHMHLPFWRRPKFLPWHPLSNLPRGFSHTFGLWDTCQIRSFVRPFVRPSATRHCCPFRCRCVDRCFRSIHWHAELPIRPFPRGHFPQSHRRARAWRRAPRVLIPCCCMQTAAPAPVSMHPSLR